MAPLAAGPREGPFYFPGGNLSRSLACCTAGLVLALVCVGEVSEVSGAEPGFTELFNGKDLTGWAYGTRQASDFPIRTIATAKSVSGPPAGAAFVLASTAQCPSSRERKAGFCSAEGLVR